MKVLITQQIQKQARMHKLKEDWNGLAKCGLENLFAS